MTRRQYQRSRIPPKKLPESGHAIHPFIRFVWTQMNKDQWSQRDIAIRAGVSDSTMRKWRNATRSPRLLELEAVLNVLGYRIKLEEIE